MYKNNTVKITFFQQQIKRSDFVIFQIADEKLIIKKQIKYCKFLENAIYLHCAKSQLYQVINFNTWR